MPSVAIVIAISTLRIPRSAIERSPKGKLGGPERDHGADENAPNEPRPRG
jgi:hypothetical protein